MNNLKNYFGLVIMGGQVCKLHQILDFEKVKPIHRKMKNYKWHLMIGLIYEE
jgi:hypothetical protein